MMQLIKHFPENGLYNQKSIILMKIVIQIWICCVVLHSVSDN